MVSRRGFLARAGVGTSALALCGLAADTEAALQGLFGRGLIRELWAQEADEVKAIEGKPEMTIHNHRPVNGENPPLAGRYH